MIDRSAPLLAAALASVSAPALAQDSPAAVPPLPPLDAVEPAAAATAASGTQPAGSPERAAWLDQCRASRPAGAVASVTGKPDLCEIYLQQYERYAAAQGGRNHLPGPVMWASVPIVRQPAEAETAPEGEE